MIAPRRPSRTGTGERAVDLAIRTALRKVPLRGALRAGWDPLAALYHYGSRGLPILQGDDADAYEAMLERRALVDPAPSAFKRTAGRGTALPAGQLTGDFPETLLARRTWRGFGTRPISRRTVGSLLSLSFGFQMEGRAQGRRVLFKTSPSGGACHPIEAYVLPLRVRGVAPGLYHYAPETHRLHQIRRGASPALATAYLSGQSWFSGAGVIVFLTAVLPRVWWRYPNSRSYRAVLLEAGHFAQTFCLSATWLGLGPFCTMALAEQRIERDLRIDGMGEVLLYAVGAGTLPPDRRWVQWPGHRPDVPGAGRTSR